jgi:predicted amidohydrolase
VCWVWTAPIPRPICAAISITSSSASISRRASAGRSDLLLFHEFPITGFSEWTREQHYRLALEVPGPETELVAQRAKKYNCYIIFGTYAKDEKNWPGHILHLMVMAKPDGSIVTHWKQRNVRGMFPGGEQYTSVIYDVYDRFVEMYGIDAVIPVERTDIGNIAMSAVQFEPELFRCMAFKGAELICRVATGGFEFDDMRLTSYHNSLYTLIANNCVNTGERNPGFFRRPGPRRAGTLGDLRAARRGTLQGRPLRDQDLGADPDRRIPPAAPDPRPAPEPVSACP